MSTWIDLVPRHEMADHPGQWVRLDELQDVARQHMLSRGACVVCWTDSWDPVKNKEECGLHHPHTGVHRRCGYCELDAAHKRLLEEIDAIKIQAHALLAEVNTLKHQAHARFRLEQER